MRDDPTEPPAPPAPGISSGSFDFSRLASLDPATIPVAYRQIKGLITVPAGQSPFSETLGESCRDPDCRYRAHELALHPGPHALLANYMLAARDSGLPPALVIEELQRDIYHVHSDDAVRIADLSSHPILYRVPVSFARLRSQASSGPEWELVRIVRDHHDTGAVKLPLMRSQGQDLIVHSDLAAELEVERVGSLQEILPILAVHASASSALGALVARVFRKR